MSVRAESTLHIVFGASARDVLREAIARAGRRDRVIALNDDRSIGPIALGDAMQRAAWLDAELGEGWSSVVQEDERSWRDIAVHRGRCTVWVSRRRTGDYASFLDFLWRSGDRPCDVVDLTETVVAENDGGAPSPVLALPMLSAESIIDMNLLDRARQLTAGEHARYRAAWERLRTENAPLRVLTPELALVSAPLDHFDAALLSYVAVRWLKSARVIGNVLSAFWREQLSQTGDGFLASRLAALAAAGRIEGKGDLRRIRFSEVRLPVLAAQEAIREPA